MSGKTKLDMIVDALYAEPWPISERKRLSALGYTIHEPSQEPCLLPISDWFPDSFVATKDEWAVISTIVARKPRNGSFRRLVARLTARGYSIKVDTPLFAMVQALKALGFSGPFWESDGSTEKYRVWKFENKNGRE
jgi:hypothetical protein